MVPFPLPLVGPLSVSQPALLDAVHEHPAVPATENEPVAAAAVIDTLDGDNVNVHVAAACEIVTMRPPTTMVPLRGAASGLTATW
jgi:hypothetical protein